MTHFLFFLTVHQNASDLQSHTLHRCLKRACKAFPEPFNCCFCSSRALTCVSYYLVLPQNWREQFQIRKSNEQRRDPRSSTIFLPITQERPNYRKAEASVTRESLSFSAREFPSAVWAGSDGLVTIQGSSGHGSFLASRSQKSAELPRPWCSLGAVRAAPPGVQWPCHPGRGALARGAGTAAGATRTGLLSHSSARPAEREVAKPSWDSLLQQEAPQQIRILALIWDLFSHC